MGDLLRGMGSVVLGGLVGSCLGAAAFLTVEALMPVTANAAERCKEYTHNGNGFELCVKGKTGVLTEQSSLNSIRFVLDQCVPNSSSYVSKHSDISGISMAEYRYAVWALCNKGWAGL